MYYGRGFGYWENYCSYLHVPYRFLLRLSSRLQERLISDCPLFQTKLLRGSHVAQVYGEVWRGNISSQLVTRMSLATR